ncbi:sigma-54-dependent Fis family transcriptional regulator [bacterium]|nr:sigma-54-dependent Fis family transcriptional regulator [bacterium]
MSDKTPVVLIVDDEKSMRHSVGVLLKKHAYDTAEAADAEKALEMLREDGPFDVILCDMRMPGMDGQEFVRRANQMGVETPIVVMSAYGSIDTAVQAMQNGAFDFISKPFKVEEVIIKLGRALAHRTLKDELEELRRERRATFQFADLVGKDEKIRAVFDAVEKIAGYKTSVLIEGESGTGKELVAKSIHGLSGRKGPFVAINCGAIPENLLESELFGHKKGAFTDATADKEGLFARADKGTLLLDEIGEMPLALQVKLLRVLQDEEVRPVGGTQSYKFDVRIIAATNQNLEEAIKEKAFREDLFYRLSVFPIHVPPLRDRPGDIPLLVEYFLERHQARLGVKVKGVRQKALALLMEYPWPGNVRELENVLERASVLAGGGYIEAEHLPEKLRSPRVVDIKVPSEMPLAAGNLSVKQNSRVLEEIVIRKALEKTRGNRTNASKLLEISHRTLLYKIQEYGIDD